jgi:hypothetical protein
MFLKGPNEEECHLVKKANPKGMQCDLRDWHKDEQDNYVRFFLHLIGRA